MAVGGKAHGLSHLLAADFPMPPGWVVLPTAFAEGNLTAGARQKITQVIATHSTQQPGVAFAVRSSGADEDSPTAAFAGVFQTILNVASPQAVLVAVETVYASRHEAAPYCHAHGLDEAQIQSMAVIIQALIPADCAGVCLAVDPVALLADQLVINAAWGLGAGVMDGRVPSDTYWLETPSFITTRQQIATKTTQLSLMEDGIDKTAVPVDRHRIPCLPSAWQKRIAQFTLELTRQFGQPQEVEWAIAHEHLWILQSRPQTALPPAPTNVLPFPITWEPEAAHEFWQLMEYSQNELPLEHDTMRVRESIREETCRIMGVDRNMEMRVWNGRAYARQLPLNLTAADRHVRRAASADLRQRLQMQGQTTWDYWGPEIVSAVERLHQFDREAAAGPALADHLAAALAVLRRHASLHPGLTIKPPDSYFAAFSAVSGLTGEEARTSAFHLLDSEENSLTRLVDCLHNLAVTARPHPAVKALVANPPPQVVSQLAALPEAKEFLQQFSELLAVYGERSGEGYGSEMSVRTPTWLEEPARPLRLVAAFLDPAIPDPAVVRKQARTRRGQKVTALCAGCEDKTAVAHFQQEWAYARQTLVVLEDHNHWIEQATGGQVRLAVIAASRWLAGQNVLPAVEAIFWLTYDEILAA